MTNEYKKVPQLPGGLDFQASILTPGGASGKNWVIADGTEFRKRPGLRPVLSQLAPDATSSDYTLSLLAPRGVIAAGEYVVGNQLRKNSFDKLTPRAGSGLTDNLYIYNDTQLVTIQDGRPVVIRKVPVMRISGVNGFYRYEINNGNLNFYAANTSPGLEDYWSRVTLESTTTLQDVVDDINLNAVECYLITDLYEPSAAFSCFPNLGSLPASCLVKTEGGNWLNLDQYYNYIYAYVPFEMPLSQPYQGSTAWAAAMPTPPVYRAFYTQDVAGRDGNVMAVQFQEEMLFAGRGDALMSFDGYRMSVAGCMTQDNFTVTNVAGAGSLSAGTYNYLVRSKIQKPSGQVTYGPPIDSNTELALLRVGTLLNDAVRLDFSTSVSEHEVEVAGSTYSQVAASPRRMNPMSDTSYFSGYAEYDVTADSANRVRPQIGECLTTSSSAATIGSQRGVITAVTTNGGGNYFVSAPNSVRTSSLTTAGISLSESWEVFRTTVGGSFYYHVQTVAAGDTYIDQTSDATLQTQQVYVAKAYNIQRPPDCCVAVAQHQNRIVVVGEYLTDDNGGEVTDVTLSANRPYMKNVYWSQPNNEEFNPLNNVILDVTEGGELNSIVSTGDGLYIGGGESMWVIQGNLSSADSFTVNRIAGAGGTVGNTAIAALNGQVFAVSRAGLYQLIGGAADYTVGAPINAMIREVRDELLKFIRICPLKNNAGLAVIIPGMVFERPASKVTASDEVFPSSYIATERAADTVTMVFDPNTQTWSQWTGTEMYMGGGLVEFDNMTWAFPRKNDKPICVLDSKYAKDGYDTAVQMSIKGPWQTDGDVFTDKNFIRFRLFAASETSQNFVMTAKFERNFRGGVWQSADLTFTNSGYGDSEFGSQPFGDMNEMAQQVALSNQKALSVRAVLENSDPGEFPSITGWNFEIGENRKNMKQE